MKRRATRTVLILLAASLGSLARVAAQPHSYVLPKEAALMLIGSYVLNQPAPDGLTEFYVTLVDNQPRVRLGSEELQMTPEGVAHETVSYPSGNEVSDVYRFTVVNRAAMYLNFRVKKGIVSDVLYSVFAGGKDVMISGRVKRP